MAAISLIVLGMLKNGPLSAYDIQKLLDYRDISKWVKISTPSVYKKVIHLEESGYIAGNVVREGKMPEKVLYSLTDAGKKEFETLMEAVATRPIRFFLDFNAVIVNLPNLPEEERQKRLADIKNSVQDQKLYIEDTIQMKGTIFEGSDIGMAVLQQQYILTQSIETWLDSLEL